MARAFSYCPESEVPPLKPDTRRILQRYLPSIWRMPTTRQLDCLTKPDGLLTRFLREVKGAVYTVTVNAKLDHHAFAALTPHQRTMQLKLMVAEVLGDIPALIGDWEYRENGEPHFHALTSLSGAEALHSAFRDVVMKPVDRSKGGREGWLKYLLKPRQAALVRKAIRLLERGSKKEAIEILDALAVKAIAERKLMHSRDGCRRMPNRLHAHAVPPAFKPLNETEWQRVAPLLALLSRGGRPRRDDRTILDAVCHRQARGLSWRQLGSLGVYPSFQTCQRRLQAWIADGVWEEVTALLPPRMRRTFETDPARDWTGEAYAA